MSKPFLWAIMEPDGSPYMSESCVCQDREPLQEDVDNLNKYLPPGEPKFRVVALYRRKVNRGQKTKPNQS